MLTKNEFNQTVGCEINDNFPKNKPEHSILNGTYCVLEPLTLATPYLEQLYDSLLLDNKGSSWTYLPYGPFDSYSDFVSWLKNTLINEPDTLLFSILDIKDKAPVGIAGYLRINPMHAVIEIGHVHFATRLQKTPAATEALYLMLAYTFNDLKYRRCEWKCNSLNQASINAALRLGFTYEGTFRQSNVFKKKNRDTAWFSIIDSEWLTIKEKISNWLKPDNFDEQGKQRLSLASI